MRRPWFVGEYELDDDDMAESEHPNCIIDADNFPVIYFPDGMNDVRGAMDHIIKCVNHHDELVACCQLMLDFYNMDTDLFVKKYGTGISTRTLGDRCRAILTKLEE